MVAEIGSLRPDDNVSEYVELPAILEAVSEGLPGVDAIWLGDTEPVVGREDEDENSDDAVKDKVNGGSSRDMCRGLSSLVSFD